MTDETITYTVDEITEEIKQVIRRSFDRVRVEGEIADFTHYGASGHMYFSLAGENCRLQAVMFKRANKNLNFDPEEGMNVVVSGRINVYEERGEYQVIVDKMEESGLGPLEREFQELKQKLEEEGALDSSRKQPLPKFPARIGVVTSGDGAAFWDIVRTIRQRCPVVHVILYPSRVNGRESGEDIAQGIKRICEIEPDLDCLIVGRGGGSPEDLWGFNMEVVARAILDCPIPVISAVGHEVDVSISDMVADHRSPTPTGAGKDVVPSVSEMSDRLNELTRRLRSGYRGDLDRRRDQLRFMAEKSVFSDPRGWIRPFKDRFERLQSALQTEFRYFISQSQNRLDRLKERIKALGPENVLRRGYALVEGEDRIITRAKQVESGETVSITWGDGRAGANIHNVDLDE
ncbi:MAG: exodeoxyribonuclease VII large subunit [bacterium]